MHPKPLVIFDLGNTLIHYKDIPLNWSEHYENALRYAFKKVNFNATKSDYEISIDILKFYNTRINYREFEIAEKQVLNQISKNIKCKNPDLEDHFFQYFQRKTEIESTAINTLNSLRYKGINIAVFTDVPYAMPLKLVKNDLKPFNELINKIYTSCTSGFRKPNENCLNPIIKDFNGDLQNTYYIGDEDIKCAELCNINSIQYGNNNISLNPNYRINKLEEILDIV